MLSDLVSALLVYVSPNRRGFKKRPVARTRHDASNTAILGLAVASHLFLESVQLECTSLVLDSCVVYY